MPTLEPVEPPTAPSPASPGWTLRADGVGPLRIGMTSAEASAATRYRIVPDTSEFGAGCALVLAPMAPGDSLLLMFSDDRLARAQPHGWLVGETHLQTDVRTAEGLGIGSTEAQVRAAFAATRAVPHDFAPGGFYLFAFPLADTTYQLVFETDSSGAVTTLRGGRAPFVGYTEDCTGRIPPPGSIERTRLGE